MRASSLSDFAKSDSLLVAKGLRHSTGCRIRRGIEDRGAIAQQGLVVAAVGGIVRVIIQPAEGAARQVERAPRSGGLMGPAG